MLCAALAIPLQVAAVELTEYELTDTSFDNAFFEFNSNANDGNTDQASFSAYMALSYEKRLSTWKRVWGGNFDADWSSNRGGCGCQGTQAEKDYGFIVQGSADIYFGDSNEKVFYFGAASYSLRRSAVDDDIGISAGIGYGRVWNATPLAEALRIQDVLSELKLITAPLDREGVLALADVIALEISYRSKYGSRFYKGQWYSAIEQALSSVLPEGRLSALGTVKLEDVLFTESISPRRHGWLVRAGAGFQSTDFTGITDNDPKLTFQAEFAKPVGLIGQWINTSSYEPVFGVNTVHALNNQLSYTFELSNRIDWINSWWFSIQQANDTDNTRFISNTLATSFKFELANQLDLNLSLAAVSETDRPNLNRDNDDISTAFSSTISYRLR